MLSETVDDEEWPEHRLLEALTADLVQAFAAPESSYVPLTAKEVIERNRP